MSATDKPVPQLHPDDIDRREEARWLLSRLFALFDHGGGITLPHWEGDKARGDAVEELAKKLLDPAMEFSRRT